MKRILVAFAAVCVLAIVAGDAEAGCRGCRGGGFFRGRIGNGRILDRVRDRLFGPRHQHDTKPEAKPGCPDCGPKKSGEVEWPEFEGQPEQVPAPRRVGV